MTTKRMMVGVLGLAAAGQMVAYYPKKTVTDATNRVIFVAWGAGTDVDVVSGYERILPGEGKSFTQIVRNVIHVAKGPVVQGTNAQYKDKAKAGNINVNSSKVTIRKNADGTASLTQGDRTAAVAATSSAPVASAAPVTRTVTGGATELASAAFSAAAESAANVVRGAGEATARAAREAAAEAKRLGKILVLEIENTTNDVAYICWRGGVKSDYEPILPRTSKTYSRIGLRSELQVEFAENIPDLIQEVSGKQASVREKNGDLYIG